LRRPPPVVCRCPARRGPARRFTTLPQRPPGKLNVNRWTAATRPGYLSGVRVGVALVRVCFMKNAGLVIRQ